MSANLASPSGRARGGIARRVCEIASQADILIGSEEDFSSPLASRRPEAGGKGARCKIDSFKEMIGRVQSKYRMPPCCHRCASGSRPSGVTLASTTSRSVVANTRRSDVSFPRTHHCYEGRCLTRRPRYRLGNPPRYRSISPAGVFWACAAQFRLAPASATDRRSRAASRCCPSAGIIGAAVAGVGGSHALRQKIAAQVNRLNAAADYFPGADRMRQRIVV